MMGNLMLKRDYGFSGIKTKIKITPRLYGGKLSPVEVSTAYSSNPERANLSFISEQKVANRLHERKEKVGSAFLMVGSPF